MTQRWCPLSRLHERGRSIMLFDQNGGFLIKITWKWRLFNPNRMKRADFLTSVDISVRPLSAASVWRPSEIVGRWPLYQNLFVRSVNGSSQFLGISCFACRKCFDRVNQRLATTWKRNQPNALSEEHYSVWNNSSIVVRALSRMCCWEKAALHTDGQTRGDRWQPGPTPPPRLLSLPLPSLPS